MAVVSFSRANSDYSTQKTLYMTGECAATLISKVATTAISAYLFGTTLSLIGRLQSPLQEGARYANDSVISSIVSSILFATIDMCFEVLAPKKYKLQGYNSLVAQLITNASITDYIGLDIEGYLRANLLPMAQPELLNKMLYSDGNTFSKWSCNLIVDRAILGVNASVANLIEGFAIDMIIQLGSQLGTVKTIPEATRTTTTSSTAIKHAPTFWNTRSITAAIKKKLSEKQILGDDNDIGAQLSRALKESTREGILDTKMAPRCCLRHLTSLLCDEYKPRGEKSDEALALIKSEFDALFSETATPTKAMTAAIASKLRTSLPTYLDLPSGERLVPLDHTIDHIEFNGEILPRDMGFDVDNVDHWILCITKIKTTSPTSAKSTIECDPLRDVRTDLMIDYVTPLGDMLKKSFSVSVTA